MAADATIERGFAEIGAGAWLTGRAQPVASFGAFRRRPRKGWIVRDRARLDLVETDGRALCSDAARPFLTHVPCAAPVTAVTDKVLVAPAEARTAAHLVKVIPMSFARAICVTTFGREWVVLATAGRTTRLSVADGETLAVRPEAAVAWTGGRPTGFCPRLGLFDVLLPRGPRTLLLHFHGPCIVWIEGSFDHPNCNLSGRRVY